MPSPRIVGCTVASATDLTAALVAATSFLAHHPDATFVVALTSTVDPLPAPPDVRIELRPLADLPSGPPGWQHLQCTLDPRARSFPARPRVVRALLEEHDRVLLLDPDSFVVDDLLGLIPSPAAAAGWTITPTRLGPLPDDDRHDFGVDDWLALPRFSGGCMGFDRRATPFLEWWASRAYETPRLADVVPGRYFDLWIDLGVATFGPEVVRDAGIAIGFWNADERRIDRARHLQLTGFDPEHPWLLAAHHARHPRVSLGDSPALAALVADYADELYRWQEDRIDADPMVEQLGPLAPVLREVLHHDTVAAMRAGLTLPPTPLDPDGEDAFRTWLLATSETPGEVPLLAYALWCSRPDCQESFPDLADPVQRDDFLRWVDRNAALDHPEIDWDDLDAPPYDEPSFVRVSAEPFGVDVVGYLAGEFGLGEAGRRLTDALTAVGVPVSTIAYRDVDHRMLERYRTDDVFRHDVVILSVNAPETPLIHAALRPQLRNRHLIGYWHWEVQHSLPEQHLDALSLVDEVWAPSSFIAGLFEPYAPGRVHAMPYPLSVTPSEPRLSRSQVGFGDEFTFLFVFDFYSSSVRKNPHAVIDAYRLAFGEGDGATLHLKSINGKKPLVAGELEALRWAARDRGDIVIRDTIIEPYGVQSMIANCDCYVSLHRSEGVGSTISDAMAAGRPVIATAFGGNLEFMTDETSYLVATRGLARVGPLDYRAYPEDGFWADPDPQHAAELMRAVFDDQATAAAKGSAAAAHLRAHFSVETTGDRMLERLGGIRRERSTRGRQKPVWSAPAFAEAPIAISSFDRPRQLERVLASLRGQTIDLDDDRVHLFQDGAVNAYSGFVRARQDTVDECVELFRRAFPGGHCHVSRWHLGAAEHALRAETAMFEDLRAPVAYFLDDDLELAPTYLSALEAIWDAVRDEPLIGYVNGLGPPLLDRDQPAIADFRALGLRRDHWLRLSPLLSAYYRLVLGQDYAHRPEDAIRALFRSWDTPSAATSPAAAKAAASLAVGSWGLTTTACLCRPSGDVDVPAPPNGLGKGLPTPPVVPTPEEIDALVASAIASAAVS